MATHGNVKIWGRAGCRLPSCSQSWVNSQALPPDLRSPTGRGMCQEKPPARGPRQGPQSQSEPLTSPWEAGGCVCQDGLPARAQQGSASISSRRGPRRSFQAQVSKLIAAPRC